MLYQAKDCKDESANLKRKATAKAFFQNGKGQHCKFPLIIELFNHEDG